MAKVNGQKRINSGDFDKEDQAFADKLGYIINPFFEQLTAAFNKGIDFDNLNMQLSTFTTEVDGSFVPKIPLDIRIDLRTKVQGSFVINATNLTDSTLLSGAPFLNYDIITNGVHVNQVTGLAANKSYRVTVVFIG